MIHTMTIQHEIPTEAVRRLLSTAGRSGDEIEAFVYGLENPRKKKVESTTYIRRPYPGIHNLSISRVLRSGHHGGTYTEYYAYIRLEPLTVVTKEQHIALFNCTDEHIQQLRQEFRNFMVECLQLDGTLDSINELAELDTWGMNRVDYTKDIVLQNHDEVLALMNLFKMSVLTTRQRRSLHPLSIYGAHFYDDTFRYGNQSWEFEAYDKQAEIRNHRERYVQTSSEDIYERLVDESKNILRIEYRRKKNGTQKGSTGFVDKNVMRFLSEQVAETWFHEWYGKLIGYEPFYVLDYQLDLKLAEAFPLSKLEARKERARKKKYDREYKVAKAAGKKLKPYKKMLLGQSAQKYRNHMSFIASHNGMQNALEAYDGSIYRFKSMNKSIRERAHVSPVAVPKNWLVIRDNGNGRGMQLPHDFLPNPVQRPGENRCE